MGHNISKRKRHSSVMSSPLADFAGWRLEIECGGERCPTGRAYPVKDMASFWPGLTVSQTIMRMRCELCGQKPPAEVRLAPMATVDLRQHGVVVLRGPGAY